MISFLFQKHANRRHQPRSRSISAIMASSSEQNINSGSFSGTDLSRKRLKESISQTPELSECTHKIVSFKLLARSLKLFSAVVLTKIKFFYHSMIAPYICRCIKGKGWLIKKLEAASLQLRMKNVCFAY